MPYDYATWSYDDTVRTLRKNDLSNRRPKNSRPNLSTDMRLKIACAPFDLRYPHQPFKAARVLSFDAQNLYRPCFERNWRRMRIVTRLAKKMRVRDARSSQIGASSEGSGVFRAPSKICNAAIAIGKIGRSQFCQVVHIRPLFSPCW